ncbi:AtzE family amidohydrolase [Zavarzinia compransoris]|uniref:AtzE family amidohydrolase n=1 Tax=Zavarzinia compransoris TaxID=1264899 RepID=A0A317DYX2_9PROT|nr:AtzE family amidohydrolase [Zavarzinia compransoris]PWR19066.1 AtzE family amidohydrolase [Zavarzinia compransoris]TDP49075.1 aspartyl-tRNA(Asn)/glutamyl-tRNA(Gln) amidotransferase subunit A [Zavarzinia compransoris]
MTVDVFASAASLAADVRSGRISATAVASAFLDRIAAVNPVLNAYTDVTAARALAAARAIDDRRSRGEALGPLAGVPFAAKNLFDLMGLPTRAGSLINRERAPASRDAVLVERLLAADAVPLGALNMGEYAYDFTGENAHDGACRNPHDPDHMAGGSSSGCGAATGGGMAPISLGSDTNGSIRVPSSLCGTFGLKPTYGRLPRSRSFPFCDSLDHLGPFARTATDLALAYDLLQGFDAGDHACADRPAEPVLPGLDRGIGGLRIAVLGGHFDTAGLPAAGRAVETVARALGAGRTVDLPGAAEGRAAAFIITNTESAAFHLDRLRRRADDFDPETRDRFLAGAMLPAAWAVRAHQVRRWYAGQAAALFRDFDLLIAPATPMCAPKVGQKTMELRGRTVPVRPMFGLFTQPVSAIGLPVCAVPVAGAGDGVLPIGVQLIAAPWREDVALRAAAWLEAGGVAQATVPAL